MASKGRESWGKRQREQTKRERQEAKRAERAERRQTDDVPSIEEGLPEEELYKQFAELSAAKANGEIDEEAFEARKEEIWTQLGLELQ